MDYNNLKLQCPQCRHIMNATEPFCRVCGTRNQYAAYYAQQAQQARQAQQVPAGYAYQQGYGQPAVSKGKMLAHSIVSLSLGATALLFAMYAILFLLTIPCAIVGIVLGNSGINLATMSGRSTGMARAGLIMSIVALGVNLITFILFMSFIA